MNTTLTPDKLIISQIGNEQAVIYIAVLAVPEMWDHISNGLLSNALSAGLKREALEPSITDGFYHRHISVKLYVVPREMRGAFILNSKNTLSELRILEHATIALGTADHDVHLVHDGLQLLPGTSFQRTFLRPEFIEAFQAQEAARKQRMEAYCVHWERAYLEEKQKRESGEQGDAQQ